MYAWLLGRLTFDGKICCMLFGQFSKDIEPPTDGWIYVGKNVDRNLLSTDAVASKFLDDGSDARASCSDQESLVNGRTSTDTHVSRASRSQSSRPSRRRKKPGSSSNRSRSPTREKFRQRGI